MPNTRGRPRQFDDQDVRQAILQKFWEKGFAATSLDDLSKATGLVRPSLYGAFGSKSEMFLMSMGVYLKSLEGARNVLSSARTAEQAMDGFFVQMLDVYIGADATEQLGCFLVGAALTEAPLNDELRKALAANLNRITGLLGQTLQTKLPDVNPDDIQFAAEQAAATLHSLAVRARAGEGKDRLTEFAQRSASHIIFSLSQNQEAPHGASNNIPLL